MQSSKLNCPIAQIWSQYAEKLEDFARPANLQQGLRCLNHLIADALGHVPDVFTFMARLREQSVFNFCSIPQVMAMATLALCYNNSDVFKMNVKIRKGLTVGYAVVGGDMICWLKFPMSVA
jgi:farnesyl-diphosphate farnesyltransferase